MSPIAPRRLAHRGVVEAAGFVVQARLLGGNTRLDGGLRAAPPAGEPPLLIRAQG